MAPTVAATERGEVLSEALRAYQAVGDSASELRLITAHSQLQVNYHKRYYELLARYRPDQLINLGLPAIQALIAAGNQERTLQSIRMQPANPMWNDAYTSLASLYFGSNSPKIRTTFQQTLGPQVIQESLA